MFKSLKKLRRSWSDFVNFDPEAERLAQAGDLIDLERSSATSIAAGAGPTAATEPAARLLLAVASAPGAAAGRPSGNGTLRGGR